MTSSSQEYQNAKFLLPGPYFSLDSNELAKILTYFTRETILSVNHFPNDLLQLIISYSRPIKTLVLNLNETLIHSNVYQTEDFDFTVQFRMQRFTCLIYVKKRPYLDLFLDECSKLYEIVIWAKAVESYGGAILDNLDKNKNISHIISSENAKNLDKLGRNWKHTIIVSSKKNQRYSNNDIIISQWKGNKSDEQLLDLLAILKKVLYDTNDVTNILGSKDKSFKSLINLSKKT